MNPPRCVWVAGIGEDKDSRPCVVLFRGEGWYLAATGSSVHAPHRGRTIVVRHGERVGKSWGLSKDTYFDPLSFTTLLDEATLSGRGEHWVPHGLLQDLLDLFGEAVEAGQLRRDDPQLLAAAALIL